MFCIVLSSAGWLPGQCAFVQPAVSGLHMGQWMFAVRGGNHGQVLLRCGRQAALSVCVGKSFAAIAQSAMKPFCAGEPFGSWRGMVLAGQARVCQSKGGAWHYTSGATQSCPEIN
ncbi:unnamed protein product [Effrenium voratum]|uniref:Uncharacterized protein n=1 Tax=Effrenium voratum TaxID=2562239 RepID=A0AA36MLK5_9DINO|nr:unnamed protein product [Effrenium voratum]CAJ1445285.1 unnamed protein product [Effrenium voratum]